MILRSIRAHAEPLWRLPTGFHQKNIETRYEPANTRSYDERKQMAEFVPERRVDCGRQYPELGEIDHHEQDETSLPDGLAADAVAAL